MPADAAHHKHSEADEIVDFGNRNPYGGRIADKGRESQPGGYC